MAGFTESGLVKKLLDLNSSAQSIQTLSLWLIHHRKHSQSIVRTWFKELLKAKGGKKLTFMYLANDVIQNSKKKGPEFGKEFGNVLRKSFEAVASAGDEKTSKSLGRILNIWEERGVYDKPQIDEFKKGLTGENDGTPPKKKHKLEAVKPAPTSVDARIASMANSLGSPLNEKKRRHSETEIEVEGTKEVHITLSPRTPAGDPPEPEELIKALRDLENEASADVEVRERIAKLPTEVSQTSLLDRLQDKAAAEKLAMQVNDAVALLTNYNARLSKEMEQRKHVAGMLRDFLQAQMDLKEQAEGRLAESNEKLKKVYELRMELRNHLQKLPDLTQLPDVTGGLAPLPSAGDLFSPH
ncbi:regulation of nuclear pre-mRNA domain-containing protein 1B [Thrips palmi]|uniref:Regulation of nuclear pre-mRNA domain-containing protein 1B n=1 Tax=Thrips palmi TaxID=161013 RepID=A0A6P9A0Z7_THRPL|nr:regulation of nuclear pre-mRNA domain-containing protein 1B [Thrips palmi]